MNYNKEEHTWEAIHNLVGGDLAGRADGINIVYHDDQTPPTQGEIDTELVRMQAEYDAQEYARKRQAEYPALAEQLDMQYHDQLNGTTTWKDAVAKVKADNPKEAE